MMDQRQSPRWTTAVFLLTVLLCSCCCPKTLLVNGFSAGQLATSIRQHAGASRNKQNFLNLAAVKKGFGNTTPPASQPKKKKQQPEQQQSPSNTVVNSESLSSLQQSQQSTISQQLQSQQPKESQSNPGQVALKELRRKKAEEKNAELQRMREMIQADEQVKEEPAAIPEKVAQRMGERMLAFVGVPLFLGMGAFVTFWYFATYKNLEFQPALVAITTIGILGISLVGITYSVMSTSWDEDPSDDDGGFLGLNEFQRNFNSIKDGLSRSKENLILREKMATSRASYSSLNTPKKTSSTTPTSLEDKLKQELE